MASHRSVLCVFNRGGKHPNPGQTFRMVGNHVYYVYILASGHYGTLYTGVTNDVIARTYDHRLGEIPGLTQNTACIVWSGSRLAPKLRKP